MDCLLDRCGAIIGDAEEKNIKETQELQDSLVGRNPGKESAKKFYSLHF